MKFCQDHWGQLRAAIDARGLSVLVSEGGEKAAANLASSLADGGTTIDNFDPLMGAHNAIMAKASSLIADRYQQNPLMLFADEAEHPEWACPICALRWCHDEHDRLCTKEGCDWPKEFDWSSMMVNGAADAMLAKWESLRG